MTAKGFISVRDTADVVGAEYWAKKGDVDLFLYRKTAPGAAAGTRPVLFLVHGSSQASRTSYDLKGPGDDEYSVMNVFAKWGYDVWTMDHEGYGRPSRTPGYSYILDGAEGLKAAMPVGAADQGQAHGDPVGAGAQHDGRPRPPSFLARPQVLPGNAGPGRRRRGLAGRLRDSPRTSVAAH